MLCHHHPMTEPCPAESCRNRENLSCLTLWTVLMWWKNFGSSLNWFGMNSIVLSQSMRDTHPETGLQIDKRLYLALPIWSCELIELLFHTDAVSSRTPLASGTTNVWLNERFFPPSGMPTKEPSHIMNFWTPCGSWSLSILLIPSQSSSTPLYPSKMLRAKELAPTPCSSVVFSLDSHLNPLRSLGTHRPLARDSGLQTGWFKYQMICGYTWLPSG
jgi:hypothetical protein